MSQHLRALTFCLILMLPALSVSLAQDRPSPSRSIILDGAAADINGSLQEQTAALDKFGQRPADSHKINFGLETDFNSQYLWRGIVLSDRPVLQPSAWISGFGFEFTAWRNLNLTRTGENVHLHTTNLNLTYSHDWKKVRIEPSLDAYLNQPPKGFHDPNTMEASLKLSYPVGRLRIFTSHAFDVITYRGSYFGEAGVSYEGRLTERVVPAVSITAGWSSSTFNKTYIGFDKRAFNFVGAEASVTYYLRDHLYLRPHFEFSTTAARELREYLDFPTSANFGLAVGMDF